MLILEMTFSIQSRGVEGVSGLWSKGGPASGVPVKRGRRTLIRAPLCGGGWWWGGAVVWWWWSCAPVATPIPTRTGAGNRVSPFRAQGGGGGGSGGGGGWWWRRWWWWGLKEFRVWGLRLRICVMSFHPPLAQ